MRDKITLDSKNRMVICIVVILCCGLLALVDGYWKPAYGVKAGIKVLLFFCGSPGMYLVAGQEE